MRIAFFMTVLVIATAGVASAQTVSKGAATSPACALLTKEDAAAALGEAVSKGPDGTAVQGGPSSCSYDGSGIHTVTLNVYPLKAGEAAMYTAMCAQKTKEGLTGLGPVTCWYNEKHGELQVLKGLTMFSIELRRNGDPTEAIKTAARKVYERVK